MGFKPYKKYSFSIDYLWKDKNDLRDGEKFINSHKKAHLFHFERWKLSLRTKYCIEALFIFLG